MLIKSRFLNVCVLVYIVLSTYNPTLGLLFETSISHTINMYIIPQNLFLCQ